MLKWALKVPRVGKEASEAAAIQDNLIVAFNAKKQEAKAPRPRKGPHHKWPPQEKERYVNPGHNSPINFFLSLRVGRLYLEKGYAFLKTNLENCPPENTVKGWGVKCVLGGIPTRPGRPGHLTCREEILLAAAVRDLRGGGACIDRESLIFLGHETVREVCYFF